MEILFGILLAIALGLTLIVLFAGVITMGRGGEVGRKYGNKLMRWRVILQGIAVVLLVLAMLARKAGAA
jgi:hypothetical protein